MNSARIHSFAMRLGDRVLTVGSGINLTSSARMRAFLLGATTRLEPGWYPIRPAGMNVGEGGAVARSFWLEFLVTMLP